MKCEHPLSACTIWVHVWCDLTECMYDMIMHMICIYYANTFWHMYGMIILGPCMMWASFGCMYDMITFWGHCSLFTMNKLWIHSILSMFLWGSPSIFLKGFGKSTAISHGRKPSYVPKYFLKVFGRPCVEARERVAPCDCLLHSEV